MPADSPTPPGTTPEAKTRGNPLGVRSISEVSDMKDPDLAAIFTEMRRASGVTLEQIAGRLATQVDVISALESGDLAQLPEWNEVTRIVTAYTAQLGLDARPILRRMQSRLGVADVQTAAASAPAEPRPTPPQPETKPAPPPQPASPPAPEPKPAIVMPPKPPSAAPATEPAPEKTKQKPSGPPMPPSMASIAKPAAKAEIPAPPQAEPDTPKPPVPPVQAETPQAPSMSDAAMEPEAVTIEPEQTVSPEKPREGGAARKRMNRFFRGLMSWGLLLVFVAGLGFGIFFAVKNPNKVWNALDSLPDPIPGAMRGAWELMRPADDNTAKPQTPNPNARRSNKLP